MELLNNEKKSFLKSKLFIMIILVLVGTAVGILYLFLKERPKKTAIEKTETKQSAEQIPATTTTTTTTKPAKTSVASEIINKMDQVNIDQISGAVSEINSTVSSFNSVGRGR